MYESGKVSYLTEPLEEMGIAYQVFSEVKPDPDIATVTKGISIMLDFHPQILLALGGGSAIDAAKAMNYLSARQGLAEKCLFVAIPTTSGTGSEVSKFSVISDPEKSAKYPLVDDDMLPDAAILDAELVRVCSAGCDGGYGDRCADACDRGVCVDRGQRFLPTLRRRKRSSWSGAICSESITSRTTWRQDRRCIMHRVLQAWPSAMQGWG